MAKFEDQVGQHFALLDNHKEKLRLAKALEGQKPPPSMKRSRPQLNEECTVFATQAHLMKLSMHKQTVKTTFIGEAYPPCVLPISSLRPITIKELVLETQHRGRVLIVNNFGVPCYLSAIQNAIEDELGDVDRIALYNWPTNLKATDVLPSGTIVAVKEPYYKQTADGGTIVRVDHPSDIVFPKPDDSLIPLKLRPCVIHAAKSALELKDDGNAAFAKGMWKQAIDYYSDALKLGTENDGDLRRTIHRNRAAAYLRLGRYEATISDSLAAMSPAQDTTAQEANIKALYRAGKAAYEMQDFDQANKFLTQALEMNPQHKETNIEIFRTEKRLSEQETGLYAFTNMNMSATKNHTHLDHASFLKNVKVAPTANRGRGLFASNAIKAGQIVLVEKAFYAAYPKHGDDFSVLLNVNSGRVSAGTHAKRLYGIIDRILWNPTLAKKYLDLYDGGTFKPQPEEDEFEAVKVVDGKVAVDTFRVQAIAEYNGFGCPRVKSREDEAIGDDKDDKENSTGIWLQASYTNHSCLPNTNRAFVGDMMIVRALRDIEAGEEITTAYISAVEPFEKRRKKLTENYGFDCDCVLCQAEAKTPRANVAKRARLVKKMTTFLAQNKPKADGTVPMGSFTTARGIITDTQNTYPASDFERLPRLSAVPINIWMCHAFPPDGNPQDALHNCLWTLRDSGYIVTLRGDRALINRAAGFPMTEAIHAAMYAAQILVGLGGKVRAARALEAFGKEIFAVRFGVDQDFAATFGSAL